VIALTLMLAAAFAQDAPADPADTTHLYIRQGVAGGGWPTGALSDTRFEVRTPLHRSDSIVFQDTSAGAGARVAVTPAFVEAGPRVSLAPIDIFDMDLSANVIRYWGGQYGPLPTDQLGGTLSADRELRVGENVSSTGLTLQATPTLKAKVGPVIAFDAWTIRHVRMQQPDGAEGWVYEPFTDMIVAWTDTIVEHQPGLLFEAIPDEGGAWLRVGATLRDRMALATGDRSIAAGGLIAVKPGASEAVPTIAALALAYARDDDHVGGAPFIGVQAAWTMRRALRPGGA
jgi:hypothetical protein